MPRRKSSTKGGSIAEIKYEGEEFNVPKIPTGLASLDMLLGGGLPTNTVTELSGWSESGKSTVSLYLAGMIRKQGTIIYCETERRGDREYITRAICNSGFCGTIYCVPYGKDGGGGSGDAPVKTRGRKSKRKTGGGNPNALSDETRLNMAKVRFQSDPSCGVLILDSVGGLLPVAESEGDIGDAHVGLRAKLMAQFMRGIAGELRFKSAPSHVFVVNHLQPVIGGQGNHTVGGTAIGFLTSVQLRLSLEYPLEEDGSRVVVLTPKKLTFRRGASGQPAKVFILGEGGGVHPGLTAVIDAQYFGLATKENGVIKLGSKSFGRFSRMRETADDSDQFKPFYDAIAKM